MGRPEYDPSASDSVSDADPDVGSLLGTVNFGANQDRENSIGLLNESDRTNLGFLRHAEQGGDDGQA